MINVHALGAVSLESGDGRWAGSTWLFEPSAADSSSGSNESIAGSGKTMRRRAEGVKLSKSGKLRSR